MKDDLDHKDSLLESINEALELFGDFPLNKNLLDLIEGKTKKQRAESELLFLSIILELVTATLDLLFALIRRSGSIFRSSSSQKSLSGSDPTPDLPFFARQLLLFIVDEKDQESIMGDLTEEYFTVIDSAGLRRAKLWVYRQTIQSTWPLLEKTVREDVLQPVSYWIRATFSVVKSDASQTGHDETPDPPDSPEF